jgi:glutamyl-tRNA reductase
MQSTPTETSAPGERDPETVRQAIRRRSELLKRREVDQAVNKLRIRGEFTESKREIIEEMADAIVDGVLAAPESVLEQASSDEDAVETAIELFDLD